jgi:hypothetical protein
VNTVRTDDGVEPLAPAAREKNVDRVARLLERGDRLVEAIADAAPRRLEEDAREIAAQNLDVVRIDDTETARRAPEDSAGPIDDRVRTRVRLVGPEGARADVGRPRLP